MEEVIFINRYLQVLFHKMFAYLLFVMREKYKIKGENNLSINSTYINMNMTDVLNSLNVILQHYGCMCIIIHTDIHTTTNI